MSNEDYFNYIYLTFKDYAISVCSSYKKGYFAMLTEFCIDPQDLAQKFWIKTWNTIENFRSYTLEKELKYYQYKRIIAQKLKFCLYSYVSSLVKSEGRRKITDKTMIVESWYEQNFANSDLYLLFVQLNLDELKKILTETEYVSIYLKYIEGHSYREIEKITNIGRNTLVSVFENAFQKINENFFQKAGQTLPSEP